MTIVTRADGLVSRKTLFILKYTKCISGIYTYFFFKFMIRTFQIHFWFMLKQNESNADNYGRGKKTVGKNVFQPPTRRKFSSNSSNTSITFIWILVNLTNRLVVWIRIRKNPRRTKYQSIYKFKRNVTEFCFFSRQINAKFNFSDDDGDDDDERTTCLTNKIHILFNMMEIF